MKQRVVFCQARGDAALPRASGIYERTSATHFSLVGAARGREMVIYLHEKTVASADVATLAGGFVVHVAGQAKAPLPRSSAALDDVEMCWIVARPEQMFTGLGMFKTKSLFKSRDETLFEAAKASPAGAPFLFNTGGHWIVSSGTRCDYPSAPSAPCELLVSGLDIGTPYSVLCGLYKRVEKPGARRARKTPTAAAPPQPAPTAAASGAKFGPRQPLKRLLTDERLGAAQPVRAGDDEFPVYEGVQGVGWAAMPDRPVYLFRTRAGRWVISWADQIDKAAPLCWIRSAGFGAVAPANVAAASANNSLQHRSPKFDDETASDSEAAMLGSPSGAMCDPYDSDATEASASAASASAAAASSASAPRLTGVTFPYEVASATEGWAPNACVTVQATARAAALLRAEAASPSPSSRANANANAAAAQAQAQEAAESGRTPPPAKKRRTEIGSLPSLAMPSPASVASTLPSLPSLLAANKLGALSPLPYSAAAYSVQAVLPIQQHRDRVENLASTVDRIDLSLPQSLAPSPRSHFLFGQSMGLAGLGTLGGLGQQPKLTRMPTVEMWRSVGGIDSGLSRYGGGGGGGAMKSISASLSSMKSGRVSGPSKRHPPRRRACGECDACVAEPCGLCACCVNKKRKKKCVRNRCLVLKQALKDQRALKRTEEKLAALTSKAPPQRV